VVPTHLRQSHLQWLWISIMKFTTPVHSDSPFCHCYARPRPLAPLGRPIDTKKTLRRSARWLENR
jgi:hypothetical protein